MFFFLDLCGIKDKFTQKGKFSHCLLSLMLMQSQVKFFISPQKHFWSFKVKQCCSTPKSPEAPRSKIDLKRRYFHIFSQNFQCSCWAKIISVHLKWVHEFACTSRVWIMYFQINLGSHLFRRLELCWFCCNAVLLWNSRNVLWTTKLPLPFHHPWGQVDNVWISHFGVNCSIKM